MNPSTASGRLLKDLLFSFATQLGYTKCYHCNKKLTRETFSIEHKTPWLDSEDPIGLFFNLDNISFSHHTCNTKARRITNKKYFSKEERRLANNRLSIEKWYKLDKETQKTVRREKYLKHGY